MINEDGVIVPDPDPQSLLDVRAARKMVDDWQSITADWPPISQLIAEIEAKVDEQFGGPLVTPTLPPVRRATWAEIREQLAARPNAPASRPTRLMLPGALTRDPAMSQIRAEVIPASPEPRKVVEAEVVERASGAATSWRQIKARKA